ncbi:MAG TPA: hypothetical protein VMZ53_29480 [Kofleriaceae bacterium]|nr:hypothetical protein [Kofleriaceae bacterium]
MVTTRIARPTDLVFPLVDADEPDPIAEAEAAATELDWSFHDAELTQQLKAVHRGRGWLLLGLTSSVLAIAAGVAIVI